MRHCHGRFMLRIGGMFKLFRFGQCLLPCSKNIDLLVQNGHYPVDFSSECGDQLVDYIPGVSPIRLADMPSVLKKFTQPFLSSVKESVAAACKAKCLLFTTYDELEHQVIASLMKILPLPVYSVGPSIPLSAALEDETHNNVNRAEHYYLDWLDSQPENSVLYVSFGSFLSASSEQMEEILSGLDESGVRYFLVSRGGKGHTENSAADGDAVNVLPSTQSFLVPWCDQLRVLCHYSVGGFWTHCGWNSTLEGVYAGVPMLTFPVAMDQFTNSKLIVDDWKIGMKVMKEVGADKVVKRDEIASTVKKFMNLNGDDKESKEMRDRANEFKKRCRQVLAKGGSSTTNLDNFIRNILKN
ncbi:UDP-glycosyltransferase 87A1-like [Papaver somniferum]|uniref:UDP-glycosyltransferase 87A1-like n=1 Tax=Papaver somniferum TaxID=3469 RepID=UPI000E6F527A|nr:UDP-glycosyltransferase 87A1-like [Papaver somniferum]